MFRSIEISFENNQMQPGELDYFHLGNIGSGESGHQFGSKNMGIDTLGGDRSCHH